MSTKDIVLDVDISTKQRSNVNTHQEWRSYDHAAAQLVLHISKNSEKIDADSVKTVRLLITSIDAYSRVSKDLAYQFDVPIDTDSTAKCLLPDEIVCYDGRVAVHVYVEFKNGASNDVGQCFYIDFKPSAIDTTIEHVGEYYFKSFDDVLKEVNEIAVDVANAAEKTFDDMVNYEAGLDSYAESKKSEMDTVLVDVAKTGAAEKEKIQAELPKVASVTTDEITKIKSELPKVQSVTVEETTKIQSELPKVQTVATEEIGKIRDVLSTVEQTAQEVSDYADQKIAEYDDKFVSTDQKMTELEQSQVALDAELKATQQQIADADVYTKAEADARNLSPAWSWSADGTDRFTTVYPGENLLAGTADYSYGLKGADTVVLTGDDGYNGHAVIKTTITPSTLSSTGSWRYSVPKALDAGTYTLSFKAKSSIEGTTIASYFYNPHTTISSENSQGFKKTTADGTSYLTLTTEWKTYWITWKQSETASPKTIILARIFKGNVPIDVYITEPKFESGINHDYIYTPAPSEDPLNAYPTYKGLRLAPSDNPADYDWSYTDEYVDYLKNSSVSKTEFNDLAARLAALENKEV